MKAWQLLEQKGWCQFLSAKDINGVHVEVTSPDASSFCLQGALRLAYGYSPLYEDKMELIWKELYERPDKWNDAPERTKQEVIDLLKKVEGE